MRIGWVRDFTLAQRQGGAQVCEKLLREKCPDDIELVVCPPNGVSVDVDAYIALRCQTYSVDEIRQIVSKPCLHMVFDYWEWGNFEQRAILLSGARKVLFNSPLHKQVFTKRWGLGKNGGILPPPIDVDHWLAVRSHTNGRNGAMWYGEAHPYKGLDLVVRWAVQNNVRLDVYGIGVTPAENQHPNIRIIGQITDEQRDMALATHEQFVHFPRAPEGFCYSMMEAWLSGLEVTYCGRTGLDSFDKSWLEIANDCSHSAENFWNIAQGVM